MKNLKKLIEHIFTKKNIKIYLFVFIVLGFFIGSSFAASSTTAGMTPVQKISYLIHILTSILSRGWVVLATLAGKFMTNDFVYGTFLHLDKALWDLWNMMKNFANFTLGVLLIFTIVKNLFTGSFGDKSPIQNAKDTVIHTLIAGVLIQMSRFLMAALLDLSTIATVAVGALPSQFMVSSTDFQNNMTELIKKSSAKIEIDFANNGNIVDAITTGNINTDEDVKKILDTITPSSDSMVGPLIFLGASVFNLYDLSDSSNNEAGTDDWGDLFLSLGINGFVLFAFSLMLALIFLFNLFRVITLWIIIPLTPFVILLSVFNKEWGNLSKDNKNSFLFQAVDYKNIIKLVFKPVYMTLVLSIVLIVMVFVRTLVKTNNGSIDLQDQNNMTIQSKQVGSGYVSSLDVGNVAKINMNGRESIVDLLVYLVGLVLMVMLMKSCVSGEMTGIKFIDDKINNLSKLIWGGKGEFGGILGKTGVIPIGDTKVGIGTLASRLKGGDMLYEAAEKRLGINRSEQDVAMERLLGINTGSFTSLNTIAESTDENRKDRWLAEAIEIGSSKYSSYDKFLVDPDFQKALSFYQGQERNRGNKYFISPDDLKDEWNGKREKPNNSGESEGGTSTKTSQSEQKSS